MGLTRRTFLQLLASLPGAVVAAKLPSSTAPATPAPAPFTPPTPAALLDAIPIEDPPLRLARFPCYIEVEGVRVGVQSISLESERPIIVSHQMEGLYQPRHYGLDRMSLIARTEDDAAMRLREVYLAGEEVDAKIVISTPEMAASEIVYNVRGVFDEMRMEAPPAGLIAYTFGMKIFGRVDMTVHELRS